MVCAVVVAVVAAVVAAVVVAVVAMVNRMMAVAVKAEGVLRDEQNMPEKKISVFESLTWFEFDRQIGFFLSKRVPQ